jgi:hypothetical protein
MRSKYVCEEWTVTSPTREGVLSVMNFGCVAV